LRERGSWRAFTGGLLLLVGLGVVPAAAAQTAGKSVRFGEWLEALKKEALAGGISRATLEEALTGLSPISRVIELDRSQPEVRLTLEEYLSRVVSDARVATGRERLAEHGPLLKRVQELYGVSPQHLVALWGIESDFGRIQGKFPVIGATATLAHDGRRSAYFRKELLLALRILDQGHISLAGMNGSWAGAMGQFQFMPSTFVSYAVDQDGDGRKDIWTNLEDAVASAAHYLARMGWESGQPWGWEVRLPKEMEEGLLGMDKKKRVSQWREMGVRRAGGGELPGEQDWEGGIVAPAGIKGRAFLVSRNYRAVYKWNPSHSFAIAVGVLADRIGEK
jgi:membrane-bound lytic murein transglycosylase B